MQVQAAPGLPLINVDEERIVQVLGNLVGNSLRHTPEGGQITLSTHAGLYGVQISVQDTGEGIPPEALPFVFDRFYRVDDSRHGKKGETGLGLAIAKSIMDAHGGDIWVESQPGQGARFTIQLPSS